MTKKQIIEAYKNDLTLMAIENKRLTDTLIHAQEEKTRLYILNEDLRKENDILRLQNINLLKGRSK